MLHGYFFVLLKEWFAGRCMAWFGLVTNTLQGTNISTKNCILKMIFLFPRWDMLIPWRVILVSTHGRSGIFTVWKRNPPLNYTDFGTGPEQKGPAAFGVWDSYTVDGWNLANQLRLVVYPISFRVLYIPWISGATTFWDIPHVFLFLCLQICDTYITHK